MSLALLTLFVRLQTHASLVSMPTSPMPTSPTPASLMRRTRGARRGDRGQATTEYALVLLAAALVGLLVVAWATAGGGAERVGRLFNRVLDSAIERV